MADEPGVRIWHPTARNAVATFSHLDRPYRRWNPVLKKYEATPLFCPACAKPHAVKTYHIRVDSEGFAFVSRDIWELMRRHQSAGFQLANGVATPPAQVIGSPNGKPLTRLEL